MKTKSSSYTSAFFDPLPETPNGRMEGGPARGAKEHPLGEITMSDSNKEAIQQSSGNSTLSVPGNHKPNCSCRACRGYRARRARGEKPLKIQAKERAERKRQFALALAEQIKRGEPPDATSAAIEVGYNARGAGSAANAFLEDRAVQEMIADAFASAGVTVETLARLAADALGANKIWRVRDQRTGEIIERSDPDWRVRRQWFESVIKLLRLVDNQNAARAQAQQTLNVQDNRALVVIHLPQPARAPGHDVQCQCPECVHAWEERAQKVLARRKEIMRKYGIAD
jgi:hypothetical protein